MLMKWWGINVRFVFEGSRSINTDMHTPDNLRQGFLCRTPGGSLRPAKWQSLWRGSSWLVPKVTIQVITKYICDTSDIQ